MPIILSTFRQRGAATIENTIATLVFLLFALVAYESAHWLLLRQALNTALLDSARAAATQHAHPYIVEKAFITALENWPAFSFKTDKKYWHIEQKSAVKPLTNQTIQHNYQALQYLAGDTAIFDANILHLHLRYLHQPSTPIVRQAIRLGALLSTASFYQDAYKKGLVPIVTDVQVTMQSDQARPLVNQQGASDWLQTTLGETTNYQIPNFKQSQDADVKVKNANTAPTETLSPWQPNSSNDPSQKLDCEINLCCAS